MRCNPHVLATGSSFKENVETRGENNQSRENHKNNLTTNYMNSCMDQKRNSSLVGGANNALFREGMSSRESNNPTARLPSITNR
jgi:hypothetical protein